MTAGREPERDEIVRGEVARGDEVDDRYGVLRDEALEALEATHARR